MGAFQPQSWITNGVFFYTDSESEDEGQATADEVREFKKQYDAMTSQEKARLPSWLLEYFQQV
jgi:uncharacterized protein YecA (UPF0149 family)